MHQLSEGIEINLKQVLLPVLEGLDVINCLLLVVERLLTSLEIGLGEVIVMLDDDGVSHGVECDRMLLRLTSSLT